jgi:cytochrome P450
VVALNDARDAALADIFNPALRTNPYPNYRRWHDLAPVARIDDGLLIVTGYAACAHVFRDEAFGHHGTKRDRSFISLDPPDHTRLRGLVSSAFTPQAADKLRTRIEDVTRELVGEMAAAGRADLMSALATRLPLVVMCELLGIPISDRQQFAAWSQALASSAGPLAVLSEAVVAADMQARREFTIYFRKLTRQRRREPGEDLVSTLVAASDSCDALDEHELLATLTLLLVAGHEITAGLIGNGILTLLRNTEQFAALIDDPALIDGAVDETLRYESPNQVSARVARVDTSIGDIEVQTGATVILVVGAANRDPIFHPEPDIFDVRRKNASQHLSFGRGIHYCVGAHLAKLQARTVLRELAGRTRKPRLAGTPIWRTDSPTRRGLSELPIEF